MAKPGLVYGQHLSVRNSLGWVPSESRTQVWMHAGLKDHQEASVVATDGTITDGPYPESKQYLGGFTIVDVPSREQALEWATKIAVACRCAQEVREILFDPTV